MIEKYKMVKVVEGMKDKLASLLLFYGYSVNNLKLSYEK